MTIMERRLIISELEKAKQRQSDNVKCALMSKKKGDLSELLSKTPEIDSLLEILGSGKV